MPARLHNAISGILAGGDPGFRDCDLFWVGTTRPILVNVDGLLSLFSMDGQLFFCSNALIAFARYYAIYNMNLCFEIFEVFSFNRADKAFEIFLSTGTRDTIILLEGVPSRCIPRSGHHRPKLLEF